MSYTRHNAGPGIKGHSLCAEEQAWMAGNKLAQFNKCLGLYLNQDTLYYVLFLYVSYFLLFSVMPTKAYESFNSAQISKILW